METPAPEDPDEELIRLLSDPKTFEDLSTSWFPAELLGQENQPVATGCVNTKDRPSVLFLDLVTQDPPITERAKRMQTGTSVGSIYEARKWETDRFSLYILHVQWEEQTE